MFIYTVRCEFAGDDPDLVTRWLDWMRTIHIVDVLQSGALSAELVRINSDRPCFEIHYRFESAGAFACYERDHAPRLRTDSLREFPAELGLSYCRNDAEIVEQFLKKTVD